MNATVSKAFPIHERLKLEVKTEEFHATGQCRTLQFGVRLAFRRRPPLPAVTVSFRIG
jgi:hypothetical protein